MDQLPICDYEGSDYQTSFWDRGGRAYEDAAEGVALRRLLPPGGRRLLELGAGAGRNTPRYPGFQEIVLLDYSRTQLEQARQRLGDTGPDGARLRYVAADVYRLPFLAGSFDAATMIRTLHHLVDPRRALSEIHAALGLDAVFILEYANKHNLKSILRYALRRQSWSPFSPEPVEFAPLNFDFHPATMRAWLQVTGFAVERQLTVSHFRIGLLKRLVPLGILVRADALAQLTGDLWQVSPSVFVRAKARPLPSARGIETPAAVVAATVAASVMAVAALNAEPAASPGETESFFRCPACGRAPLADTPPELVCPECGKRYPVEDGIYDLRPSP
jgi:SAM-dependent methyltransferase